MAKVPGYPHEWSKKNKNEKSICEIDSFITRSQEALSELSLPHPNRLSIAYDLATARFRRYMLSNEREDLNKAIIHLTESILFPPMSWLEHGPRILQALFLLALALVKRSRVYRLPEDAIHAAIYLRHLRDQPHQAFGIPSHKVTGLLMDALAIQVEWGARNVMQNIGEMAVLCHELLTLDISDVNTTRYFYLFFTTFLPKSFLLITNQFDQVDQTLDQVIECLRAATGQQLFQFESRVVLSLFLSLRYITTFEEGDYEEATTALDRFNTSCSSGSELVPEAPHLVTILAMLRGRTHGNPEFSEEGINRARAFLGLNLENSGISAALKSLAKRSLEDTTKLRFHYFGSIDGGSEARPSNPPLYEQVMLSHPMTDTIPGFDREKAEVLKELLSGIRDRSITDIEWAIEVGRTLLPPSAPNDMLTSCPLILFTVILIEAFIRTMNFEYINESISAHRRVLVVPLPPSLRFRLLHELALLFFIRFTLTPDHNTQDLDETLELLSQCVNCNHGNLHDRCSFAFRWASIARIHRHPSISRAYQSAVSLIQDALLFAPTLQQQHATLTLSDDYHRMSLDYASYQVDLHQLEDAIVTLETGRALLWSEMRHFRTSIDQLLQTDPQLGQRFAVVNRDLEELTKSITPSFDLDMEEGAGDGIMAADPFGRLLMRQRKLLKERDELVSQIQALPGFDNFLTSLSFDTLRSSASSGPVIVINHSTWRSDILILLPDSPPSLIPTPDNFFARASALKDELLDARNKYGPESSHYNQALAHVLAELYDLVGKPVIDRLNQLNIPEQSRVWWCPTSVFCSLPLHAMGPIPSDDGEDRYFLDVYIPSYTPTLSALLESGDRDSGSPTSGLPSLLLAAHIGVPSLSEECDVRVIEQLNTRLSVKSLLSEDATPASVLDGLQDHQFVHFICHGTLEARKPFDAGFELHGNERLTLLDIVRSRLPAAEFAFLSACHTAELTEGSSADEGLHLAAAVQYCGFRSVVGTMWAMAHVDGMVAKDFYHSMFPKKDKGKEKGEPVPYYQRSARALRDAVKKLRKKRGITLERWVNFVHYGA